MLPIYKTEDQSLTLMQTAWAQQLNPLLNSPALQGRIVKSVRLAIGANTINHLLGRNLQGWTLVRKRGAASIYDTQDANTQPALTLTLVSDAVVTVDIYVF